MVVMPTVPITVEPHCIPEEGFNPDVEIQPPPMAGHQLYDGDKDVVIYK